MNNMWKFEYTGIYVQYFLTTSSLLLLIFLLSWNKRVCRITWSKGIKTL